MDILDPFTPHPDPTVQLRRLLAAETGRRKVARMAHDWRVVIAANERIDTLLGELADALRTS